MTELTVRAKWWKEAQIGDIYHKGQRIRWESFDSDDAQEQTAQAPGEISSDDLSDGKVFIDPRYIPPVVGDVIVSEERLSALPHGSVMVSDQDSSVWQLEVSGLWLSIGTILSKTSNELEARYSPLTVVWLPKTEAVPSDAG